MILLMVDFTPMMGFESASGLVQFFFFFTSSSQPEKVFFISDIKPVESILVYSCAEKKNIGDDGDDNDLNGIRGDCASVRDICERVNGWSVSRLTAKIFSACDV